MSFSSDVKEELNNIKGLKDKSMLEAELFGYLLTGNITEENDMVFYYTENEYNIERLYKILFSLGIEYDPSIKGKLYIASLHSKDVNYIFDKFKSINSNNYKKEVLKGSFLGSGSISDPEKGYHLEIIFKYENSACFVINLAKDLDIEFKMLSLKDKLIIYLKDGEQISNFLACIGANKSVLKFEDIRVFRDMKNNVNRSVNMETANLNKTIDAALTEIDAINLIKDANKFKDLPDELKEVANLRLAHPEASLKEIGLILNPKLSKSGVNHRINKIMAIAEELK